MAIVIPKKAAYAILVLHELQTAGGQPVPVSRLVKACGGGMSHTEIHQSMHGLRRRILSAMADKRSNYHEQDAEEEEAA